MTESEIKLGEFDIQKFDSAAVAISASISPEDIGILKMHIEGESVRAYLADLERKIRYKLIEINFVEKCHTQLAFESGLLVTEIKRHLPIRSFKPWLRTFLSYDRAEAVYRTLTSHENLYQAISLLCQKEQVSAEKFIAENSEIAAKIWYRLGSDQYKNTSLDDLYNEFRRLKSQEELKPHYISASESKQLAQANEPKHSIVSSEEDTLDESDEESASPSASTLKRVYEEDNALAAPIRHEKPPTPEFDATPSKLKTLTADELLKIDKDSLVTCYSILQNAYVALAQKEKISTNLIRNLKEQLEIADEEIADLKLQESRRVEQVKREKDLEIKQLMDKLAELDPYAASQMISAEEILATPAPEVLGLAQNPDTPKETLVTIAEAFEIEPQVYTSRGNAAMSTLRMTVIAKIKSLIDAENNPDQWA